MKKREADFSILFRHWIKKNPPKTTCAFELKQTQRETIPFSCVEEHQIDYCDAIKNSPKGVLIRHQGQNGEPDYLYMYRDPVFIVIKYPECFCIIALGAFMMERSTSKRKSLTMERAREISTETVYLPKR